MPGRWGSLAHTDLSNDWSRIAGSRQLLGPPRFRCSRNTLHLQPTRRSATESSTDSALVRRACAHALSNTDPSGSANTLAPLLTDPVRTVRIETAEVLAGLPTDNLPAEVSDAFSRATDEYIEAQELNADRPEAYLNLGLLYARQNHLDKADAALKTAISLDPGFAPAAVNLADLYRGQNRDEEGERVLDDAISHSPNDASLEHALGLLMVRQKRDAQGLDCWRRPRVTIPPMPAMLTCMRLR